MTPLNVTGLRKSYPGFSLEDVSFSLRPGKITGFIGRNGAGKTTTLKAILGLICRDGGQVRFWDSPELDDAVKRRIGYVSGGVRFYPGKRLKAITGVTRRFYPNWDETAYALCLRQFALSEEKTPAELSEGMKVKYALALALSHGAELLILDEPTSGLDPFSRDELLDIFLSLQEKGVTILFSTHIISDLRRCADDLLYLRGGRLFASGTMEDITAGYRVVQTEAGEEDPRFWSVRRDKTGSQALIRAQDAAAYGPRAREADLETIMLHLEQEGTP